MWFKRSPPPSSPLYVEHNGELVHPHPALCSGTRALAFLLEADLGALQELCDKWLNRPARGAVRYVVPAPYVWLSYADIERITSTDPRARAMGWVPETDVAFWIPTIAMKRAAGIWIPDGFAWFPPYLFVNDVFALAAGRELYGFNKTLAQITKPSAFPEVDRFSVEAPGFSQYRPDSQAKLHPLLEVRRLPGDSSPAMHASGSIRDRLGGIFAGALGNLKSPELPGSLDVLKLLSPSSLRVVLLKQFRAIHDIDRACYQAIIETSFRLPAVRRSGLLPGRHEITLHPMDSYPIARDLGLKGSGDPLVQTSALAFFSDFDFILELGEERFRAT
jgi:hypothetical protein